MAGGGYAQKVAVPEACLVPLPDEVERRAGGRAAAAGAHRPRPAPLLRPRRGGGDGRRSRRPPAAPGSLAVQLAKRAGAKVIALASSEEKHALCERLGADATADSAPMT